MTGPAKRDDAQACSCPRLRVGTETTSARNWREDCHEHGTGSRWYQQRGQWALEWQAQQARHWQELATAARKLEERHRGEVEQAILAIRDHERAKAGEAYGKLLAIADALRAELASERERHRGEVERLTTERDKAIQGSAGWLKAARMNLDTALAVDEKAEAAIATLRAELAEREASELQLRATAATALPDVRLAATVHNDARLADAAARLQAALAATPAEAPRAKAYTGDEARQRQADLLKALAAGACTGSQRVVLYGATYICGCGSRGEVVDGRVPTHWPPGTAGAPREGE